MRVRRIYLAIPGVIVVIIGIVLGAWWLLRPRLTTENHVFVFFNHCYQKRFVEAEQYLKQHPEIATDPKAINDGPAIVAAASFYGDPRVCELLLKYSAKINGEDSVGSTALEMAIRKGNLRVAKMLIDRGGKLGPLYDADLKELRHKILEALSEKKKSKN